MPIRDIEQRRAYQREWMRRRRAAWFEGKSCLTCGETDRLELHHEVMAEKENHSVWSWSQKRRDAEIAKCVVLCRPCHDRVHAIVRRKVAQRDHPCGTYAAYKRGCSCAECRAANVAYNTAWKKRRGRELHPGSRFCRPVPNSSATAPSVTTSLSPEGS